MIAAVDIGRDAARRAVREELEDRRYSDAEPPLITRVIGRLLRELYELLTRAADGAPGGRLGFLLLVLLLVLFVVVVLVRLRPLGRSTADAGALFGEGRTLTPAEHRERAEQAAAAGRWAEAVRERLRAVVRELERRGVLEPRPGRTADEVARDAGAAVPELAEDLRRGAHLFDEIWYGGRTADASSYAAMVAVDTAVTSARLALT